MLRELPSGELLYRSYRLEGRLVGAGLSICGGGEGGG
jgi:hypothetical protein